MGEDNILTPTFGKLKVKEVIALPKDKECLGPGLGAPSVTLCCCPRNPKSTSIGKGKEGQEGTETEAVSQFSMLNCAKRFMGANFFSS